MLHNRTVEGIRATRGFDPLPEATEVVRALVNGDERVFTQLVYELSSVMLRVALPYVRERGIAEEVVQEAWLTVLRSLPRFEGRSTVRTWILGIVINLARSRARAEHRSLPVPNDAVDPVIDPARFRPPDATRAPNHWAEGPTPWPVPEEQLLASETRKVIFDAIGELPSTQRDVLILRDMEGFTAEETCNILGLTDTNQRVLLHRARSRVREAIERYFDATEAT